MFYEWFMWHFELMDIDTKPSLDDWPISPQTKWCFVEYYARILMGTSKYKGAEAGKELRESM